MTILKCRHVIFYSLADEEAFFTFVKSIKAVRHVEGVGDSILLHVSSRPSQESLRDLIALFQRYRISGMPQLASFLTASNRSWFANEQTFWHRKVFGRAKQPSTRGSKRPR